MSIKPDYRLPTAILGHGPFSTSGYEALELLAGGMVAPLMIELGLNEKYQGRPIDALSLGSVLGVQGGPKLARS